MQRYEAAVTFLRTLPNMSCLFKLTGTVPASWRSDRRRKLTVAAFGEPQPIFTPRPLLLDAVAVCLRDQLAERLPRKPAKEVSSLVLANAVTRGYFDQWAEGVANAEHEGQDVVFGVALAGARKWTCALVPADKFEVYVAELPKPVRVLVFVHLLEILSDIRRRANEVNFDLTGANFFVTPDDPLLTYIKEHWMKWRVSNNVIAARVRWPKVDRRQRRIIEAALV